MAKYTVTRSCGHEETVALIGKNREWRLEHVETNKLCSECYQEDLKRRREEANREAAEAARDNNLPVLTGTEKQIPWAETIRQRIMSDLDEVIYETRGNKGRDELAIQEAYQAIKNKATAHWWIDRRYIKGEFDLETLLRKEYESLRVNAAAAPTNEVATDTLAESTVRPESPVTETVAEIRILEDILEIRFPERRDDFRELVKSELKMVWSDYAWKRRINFKNGTIEDRAAEAGNRLLHNGFPIRIFDAELREKAINANYKPECTRWIMARSEGKYEGWLMISWSRDEDLYRRAKAITGAKYDKPNVVVSPEHFAEVLDFAEMYKFEISDGARGVVANAKEIRDNSIITSVAEPKKKDRANVTSTPSVLEIPTAVDIADEFRDEELG
ncbi:MAG: hypothetical protein WA125_16940 [Desulfosporosinus sp.]